VFYNSVKLSLLQWGMKIHTAQRTKFKVRKILGCWFKKIKERDKTFLKITQFYLAGWKSSEKNFAEEYCWAITQPWGGHTANDQVAVSWSVDSKWTALCLRSRARVCVCVCVWHHMFTQYEPLQNSTNGYPSGT
jgi:hypothetical protein